MSIWNNIKVTKKLCETSSLIGYHDCMNCTETCFDRQCPSNLTDKGWKPHEDRYARRLPGAPTRYVRSDGILVFDITMPDKSVRWAIGLVRGMKRHRYISTHSYFDTSEQAKRWVDINIVEIDQPEEDYDLECWGR